MRSATLVPGAAPGAAWCSPRHNPQCTAPTTPSLGRFDSGGSARRLTCQSGSAPFRDRITPRSDSATSQTRSGTQCDLVQWAGTRPWPARRMRHL